MLAAPALPEPLRTIAYCDPHRKRLGIFVPAEYAIAGESFCDSCFRGEPLARDETVGGESIARTRGVRRRTPHEAVPTCLSGAQVVCLLSQAKLKRERDWILFLVTYLHGLRVSEAISLSAENFTADSLVFERLGGWSRIGKRSLRTVHRLVQDKNELLNERAAIAGWIEKHKGAHADDGPRSQRLFPISRIQFYRLFQSYGRLAGIPASLCHPHALRLSAGLRSLKEGGIELAGRFLGHRAIESTLHLLRGGRQRR